MRSPDSIWPICIEPALNGWVVTIGCKTIVFTDARKMAEALEEYVLDPKGTMAYVREEAHNGWLLGNTLEAGPVQPGGDPIPAAQPPRPRIDDTPMPGAFYNDGPQVCATRLR